MVYFDLVFFGGQDACSLPIVIKQFIRDIKVYRQRKNAV